MGRPIISKKKKQTKQHFDEQEQMLVTPVSESERIVYLSGEVNESSITQVIANLISLASQSQKSSITLIVSTYGGAVDEMFGLYDTIKYLPCPVQTVGIGKIMSAGVLLLASGEKGSRLIGENARIMIHPISGYIEGNIFQVMSETQEHKRQQEQMEKLLRRETLMSDSEIEKFMHAGHDYYILPDEALRLGIVDKIIGR